MPFGEKIFDLESQMDSCLARKTRYLVVTPHRFSLTKDNQYAVDDSWGYDLEAHLTAFPNLHIFGPFDPKYEADTYSYVFSKNSTITFHHLFSCKSGPPGNLVSAHEVLERMPNILAILIRNIKKQDIVQSAGPLAHLAGPLALVLCAITRHHRRILILDADVVKDYEVAAQAEPRPTRKLFLTVVKHLLNSISRLTIAATPLTFVVGNSLYSKYSDLGNVKKIHASWISTSDVISSVDLRRKIATIKERPGYKLVFAARLFHSKGPQIAVEAVSILHKKGIPITLDIYGAGPLHDELLSLIESSNLSGITTLKGNLNYANFLEVLVGYDILLLPNMSGEQPRVLFDAMAKGVLVVASNVVSLRDVVTNNYNGVLCDPGNSASFASAIERLYLNKEDLEPLLWNGRQTARQHTIELMHESRKSVIQAAFFDH